MTTASRDYDYVQILRGIVISSESYEKENTTRKRSYSGSGDKGRRKRRKNVFPYI